MTGLEILFLIMGIIGLSLFVIFLGVSDTMAANDVEGYIIAILLIGSLSIGAGGAYGCHGYGYKSDKIEFQHMKILYSKELNTKIIIELEDKTVLVKEELKWRNIDNIYKKTIINKFGKKTVEYVIGKDKKE